MWVAGRPGRTRDSQSFFSGRLTPAAAFLLPGRGSPLTCPAQDPAHPERTNSGVEGVTTFSEGIFVGYRWLDAHGIDPLYPFGYGLSYTHFQYSHSHI